MRHSPYLFSRLFSLHPSFEGRVGATSGASSDLMQASKLAGKIVREWGFSDEVLFIFTRRSDASEIGGIEFDVSKVVSSGRGQSLLTCPGRWAC